MAIKDSGCPDVANGNWDIGKFGILVYFINMFL
jgi:hypothetical protein